MIYRFLSLLILFLACLTPLLAEERPTAERFELTQSIDLHFSYGSGIAFKKSSPYGGGSLMFYLTPSGNFEITNGKDLREPIQIPHIAVAKLKLKKKTFEITDLFPLYFKEEKKLQVNLQGVATAPNDTLWLVEEKTNSLIKVDLTTGAIKQVVAPSRGLPESLLKANEHQQGLQSIAVAPNDKVYTVNPTPLVIEGENNQIINYRQLIEFNPANNIYKIYALPIDQSEALDAAMQISDIQAIDNSQFLIIEQALSKAGNFINKIFLINLKQATDISKFNLGDIGLNQATHVQKKLLVNLNDLGWTNQQAKGLTLVDAETLAISNQVENINPALSKTEVWLVTLPKPLYFWSWKEWALFWILGFILIFSTVITVLFVSKKN